MTQGQLDHAELCPSSIDIRPDAQDVARELWATRQSGPLNKLSGTMSKAVQTYTTRLTSLATSTMANLRQNLATADDARGGSLGLSANQQRMADLGWTGAGAYYVEIARLNGQTLSLLSAVPTSTPTLISRSSAPGLGQDLAPLVHAILSYQAKLDNYLQTADGLDVPGGNAELFSGATPGEDGASNIEQVVRKLHLNERVLKRRYASHVAQHGGGMD